MSRISRSSQGQEALVAAQLRNGRKTSRSGAGDLKGDVGVHHSIRDSWMVECKDTDDLNINFQMRHWERVTHDAALEAKTPFLNLRAPMTRVYVCTLATFSDLINKDVLNRIKVCKRKLESRTHSIPIGYWRHFVFTARDQKRFPIYCLATKNGTLVICDEKEFVEITGDKYATT